MAQNQTELLSPDEAYDRLMVMLYRAFPELMELELDLPEYDIQLRVEEVRTKPRRLRTPWPARWHKDSRDP